MKWFQHFSDSYSDLKHQELIDRFGVEAYGLFWVLCELVAQQGHSYRLSSGKFWKKTAQRITKLSQKRIEEVIECLSELRLIDKKAVNKGTLYIPKMKKYSDDYTKRVRREFGESSDNVHVHNNTLHNTTLHNITRDKKRKTEGEEEQKENRDIVKILNIFKKVNPTINYGHRTNRKAITLLIKQFGFKKTEDFAEFAVSIQGKKYAPTILTPWQLREKLANLKVYYEREKNNQSKGRKII